MSDAILRPMKLLWGSMLLAVALSAQGAGVTVTLRDAAGAPLEDAVAWVMPLSGQAQPARSTRRVDVAQVNRTFVPFVTVVQVGTQVQFPNRDEIRHHVYSFSTPKRFEIKLYAGTPADPVLFDKPGEVVVGCNIHDQMIAYIYVVDSPWFGKAGPSGTVRLEGLPPGSYELHAWHPSQAAAPAVQPLEVRGDEAAATFAIALRPRVARPVR